MISSKIAAILAYASGTLLILAGATGSVGIVGTVIEYLIANLNGSAADLLSIFLHVLNVVADLGGISVIIGGWLIFNERITTGKIMITLGAGMGFLGFLLTLASAFLHGWTSVINLLIIMTQSVGWIGVILAISAMLIAKAPKDEKKKESKN
jgi:hypothetical protein